MRVAIATQTYDLKTNGQGVFTVHLAEGLARAGHRVMVMRPSDRGRAYGIERGGVQVEALRSVSLAPFYPDVSITVRARAEAASLLDRFQPEIVHLQDHYPLCRGALRAARERAIPVVGTNHFLPENMAPRGRMPGFCAPWVDKVLWRTVLDVMNQTVRVTTPTRTAAEILRRQKIRVPVEPISCGVDLARFAPKEPVDRERVRLRFGLDPAAAGFFYLGRLDPEKRVDVLLHAFRRADRSDLQLVISGRGRDGAALRRMAGQLGLEERVVFTGFIPAEDLPALLQSMDVFVMPSDAELQSIATLEAMASGRPVLAANARALPELVEDGINGYLFRAGDAGDAARRIIQLAAERERWPAMSRASLERASGHSLARTVSAYQELYFRIIESKGWVKTVGKRSAAG